MNMQIKMEDAAKLLWQEAELLDRREYDDWLKLWSDDGLYIVPIDKGMEDFAERLNFAYDDSKMRSMRVERLKSSHSMSALTAAETVRTTSRFVLKEDRGDELDIRAAQILVEFRRDKTRTVAANLDVTVRKSSDGLVLVKKVVWLIDSEEAVGGMGYLM